VRALGRIERAQGVIEAATLLPAQEEILRRDAKVGSIHYSNLIEGNELSRLEALRAVEHELPPDDRAKLELVNYVAALDFIGTKHRDGQIEYSSDFLKRLHAILTRGLGREDSRFKPHHEGEWREGVVAVGDAMAVFHVAPDPADVPALIDERMAWLEQKRTSADYPAAILAGVAHFEVAEVHPFADYNGRTARLFAIAVLYRERLMERPLFSPERYYAEDKDAYLAALRAIKRTRTLNAWLDYYVVGLATEYERLAEKVRELNAITQALPLPLQLTPVQERAIATLTVDGRRAITVGELTELASTSARTASRDLNDLAEAGVLRALGTTRDRRFALALRREGVGRPRSWSDERIASELMDLMSGLGSWPTYRDFKRAGKLPLYAAVARTGGLDTWRARLATKVSQSLTQ
jgi:Fic family protein